jgi:hypothetical protein
LGLILPYLGVNPYSHLEEGHVAYEIIKEFKGGEAWRRIKKRREKS